VTRADTDVSVNDSRDLPDPSPNVGDCSSTLKTCTLRAAIQRANHRLTGTHTLHLPPGTYRITRGSRNEDDAETGDFDIKGNIVIRGAGPKFTFIDAAGLDRVFDVRSSSLLPIRVTVRGGVTAGSDTDGGGIRAKANLTLSRVHLHSNMAVSGGGIWTDDDLSIVRTTIADNTSTGDTGALVANNTVSLKKNISIRESTFSGNSGNGVSPFNEGGAIIVSGNFDVEILHSTVAYNDPGGISLFGSSFNNQLTIHHTILANNIAEGPTVKVSAVFPTLFCSTTSIPMEPVASGPLRTTSFLSIRSWEVSRIMADRLQPLPSPIPL
jgi:hypothetical protein